MLGGCGSLLGWMGELWAQVRDIASVHKMERERRQHGHALTLVHTHAIMHTQTSLCLRIMKININMYHFNTQSMTYFAPSFSIINLWKSALTLCSVSEFGITIFQVINSCTRQWLPTCSHIRKRGTGMWLRGGAAARTAVWSCCKDCSCSS